MYHSIIFEDVNGIEKNTYDDWHLISKIRPAFAPPKPKTKYVEIPGASSQLDLSDSLTGYPLYSNRSGSFDFIIENDHEPWYKLYSDIMAFLQGRKIKAYLEEDRQWYFEGRFSVGSYSAGDSKSNPWSKLTVSYDVGPYSWFKYSSLDEWLWDPFNFYTGVIMPPIFKNMQAKSSYSEREFDNEAIGQAPVCPELTINTNDRNGVTIRFVNPNIDLDITNDYPDGGIIDYSIILYGPGNKIYFKTIGNTTGTISLGFKPGRL